MMKSCGTCSKAEISKMIFRGVEVKSLKSDRNLKTEFGSKLQILSAIRNKSLYHCQHITIVASLSVCHIIRTTSNVGIGLVLAFTVPFSSKVRGDVKSSTAVITNLLLKLVTSGN